MGTCYFCGKEIEIPHRCTFCNLTFCDDHRLPEQHNCIKAPNRDWDTFRELKAAREGYPWRRFSRKKKKEKPEHRAVQHESTFDLEPVPIHGLEPKKKPRMIKRQCSICSKTSPLYKCDYCNRLFCEEHILPEEHACEHIISTKHEKPPTSGSLKVDKSEYREPIKKYNKKKPSSVGSSIVFIVVILVVIYSILSWNDIGVDPESAAPSTTEPKMEEEPFEHDDYTYDELVEHSLELINKERTKRGLNNVTLSPIDSAQKHAEDMLEQGYFSHWSLDGKKPYMRYFDSGGIGGVSENIAYAYSSGGLDYKEKLQKSMNSMMYDDAEHDWGHRDNIIDPDHNQVSIGIAYNYSAIYLVQDFEDDYIEDYEVTHEGTVYHIIVDCEKHNWIPSYIAVFYDPLPSQLTVQEISKYPYDGSYGFGEYIGGGVSKKYYMEEGFTINAEKWTTTQYNHEAIFDLEPLFIEYGEGVYTLSIVEDDEYWTTYCIYYTN